jgi:uncharacterized alkaline shock family protein YloU
MSSSAETGAQASRTQGNQGSTERQPKPPGGAQSTQVTDRPETRSTASTIAVETEAGSTRISPAVVAKIAGLAARDIPGVQAMGGGMARRVGQLRSLIPGSSEAASQGVSVEVGQRQAAIDLNLVTWYGQSIVDISDAVRRNVVGQVEGMTGLNVVEVNIQVDDIHVETPQDVQPTRVQ